MMSEWPNAYNVDWNYCTRESGFHAAGVSHMLLMLELSLQAALEAIKVMLVVLFSYYVSA